MGCGCSAMVTVDEGRRTEPERSVPTERAPPPPPRDLYPSAEPRGTPGRGGARDKRERGGPGAGWAGIPSSSGTRRGRRASPAREGAKWKPQARSRFPTPLVPPSPPPAARGGGAARRPRPCPAEVTERGGWGFRRAGSGGPAGGARGAAPCLPRPPCSPVSAGLPSRGERSARGVPPGSARGPRRGVGSGCRCRAGVSRAEGPLPPRRCPGGHRRPGGGWPRSPRPQAVRGCSCTRGKGLRRLKLRSVLS